MLRCLAPPMGELRAAVCHQRGDSPTTVATASAEIEGDDLEIHPGGADDHGARSGWQAVAPARPDQTYHEVRADCEAGPESDEATCRVDYCRQVDHPDQRGDGVIQEGAGGEPKGSAD